MLSISKCKLRCDSQLVASQVNGAYEARAKHIARYLSLVKAMIGHFKSFLATHIPSYENHMVDALANFASSAPYPCHVDLNIIEHLSLSNTSISFIKLDNGHYCMSLIMFTYLRGST